MPITTPHRTPGRPLISLWFVVLLVLAHGFTYLGTTLCIVFPPARQASHAGLRFTTEVATAAGRRDRLRLATTTSTENSGLLAHLLPPFEQRFGVRLDVIAVGTGKALKLGENGDVDVVLVHAPEAEQAFVQAGFGINPRAVMRNDFILLGPPDDAAGIRYQADAAQVWRQIAVHQAPFVSRGDHSGTHTKERLLWQHAGIAPTGQSWYLEVGQGMGATLAIASDKQAYTLADRGTYLAYRSKLELAIVHEGDPLYDNPYSVIAVHPQRHPHVKYVLAMTFIGWLTSVEGQHLISSYRQHGQVLFHPLAGLRTED